MKPSRLLPVLLIALIASAGCSREPEQLAVPVDDAASPVGNGGPRLSGGYDRDLEQLAAALPADPLRALYSEVQTLPTETLRVAETNACRRGPGDLSLPATEVLATRRPSAGHDQPESADIVAARAQTDFAAGQFADAAAATMRECTEHRAPGRDLGEGSYAPAEQVTAQTEDYTVEGWAGARHTARVEITSNTWQDQVTSEWVLVRQGQILVSVRVEGADADAVRTSTDALVASVTDVLDGRAETPELPGLVPPTPTDTPTDGPSGTATPTGEGSPEQTRDDAQQDPQPSGPAATTTARGTSTATTTARGTGAGQPGAHPSAATTRPTARPHRCGRRRHPQELICSRVHRRNRHRQFSEEPESPAGQGARRSPPVRTWRAPAPGLPAPGPGGATRTGPRAPGRPPVPARSAPPGCPAGRRCR